MEEDPLIPLVHVWNNAAFDDSSSSCSSAWHAHATPVRRGEKENRRPPPKSEEEDADAEIARVEAEILRLSSRLHHLRVSRGYDAPQRVADAGTRPRARGLNLAPLDDLPTAAADPNNLLLLPAKQQQQPPPAAQKPRPAAKQQLPTSRGGRGLSLGPLDIAAANPSKAPAARQQPQPQPQQAAPASRILRPIKEPPVQRRRGVSLGPLEIQHGISGTKPAPAAAAAARAKPFPSKLNAIREEGQASRQQPAVPAKLWPSSNARQPLDSSKQGTAASRAKARSSSMSPRARRQSIARATNSTRGGVAAFGAAKVVADQLTPKAAMNHISTASTCRRPAGSSKVRVVPSRYSLMPGASLGAATQDGRRKESLPGSTGSTGQKEEIKAVPTEPVDDDLSPESLDKVAELLPRIRTMPRPNETPRDSGCAKRAADLVGKRSFFAAAAAGDGSAISSYQARVLEAEAPEEAAAAGALSDEAAAAGALSDEAAAAAAAAEALSDEAAAAEALSDEAAA
ncbi:hypothetical protein D1007_32115 [Hordeum vulgare]|uniref:Uncharacterized protein n=1 Tax=Hordeum vulgare subsp. vulgare TaxID=112509 RepID=A0A8I6YG96_HORVV|nr:Holliday junction resolvase MOC1, chloroplastic [Hordeum vulgare subsp. vulgare]XP_044959911.1 Holliday junction resolvase MOC1, chloroplastic [Hordeum vulgare subsp. vulgare]KAE8793275.1 hypothetical protein D1007_32115 [Hordeum vulgare]